MCLPSGRVKTFLCKHGKIIHHPHCLVLSFENTATVNLFCRFKEGLATLDFVNALEQHHNLFFPFICHTDTKLTADAMESIFHVQFSPPGSTKRQDEARVLSYWQDYLLYVEGINLSRSSCL